MLNANPMSTMNGAVQEALGSAIERVVATFGVGTAAALLLGLLVVAVEVLARGRKRKARKPRAPRSPRPRRREAYR